MFFGATVTYNDAAGREHVVSIVGIDEVDLNRRYISWMSPLARALMKSRPGDRVVLRAPKKTETPRDPRRRVRADSDGPVPRTARRRGEVTSIRELLDIELPIIQAPMAGVQGSALAVAVSNAGGLGSLPCAMLRARTRCAGAGRASGEHDAKPFNVNFFCHTPPTAGPAEREAAWRAALRPYLRRNSESIPAVRHAPDPARTPFSSRRGRRARASSSRPS